LENPDGSGATIRPGSVYPERMGNLIRVIVADDHHLVRQGIRALLEKARDIQVVGEAGDGAEAVQMAKDLRPDVMVMDIVMPRMNGTQVLEQIQILKLPTRVVILSMYSDETIVRQALRNGARGYLLKRSVTEELLLAVRSAYNNDVYLSPPVSSILLSETFYPSDGQKVEPFETLTPREREVFQLVAEGRTNNGIAQELNISEKTVEKHRANVMLKLNVRDLAGLVRLAIKYGLVSLDE
jgi:two-component system, NarL family, response regulator NreC